MQEVIIGFQKGDHILFRVHGREFPSSTDFDDGNWLLAGIEIKTGAFKGHTNCFLRSEEFEQFLKEIEPKYQTLKGSTRFASLEGWIDMEITGDGRGHFMAKGCVIDKHADGNKLDFIIKFDQTALPDTIRSLKSLLKEYPVVGR